MMPFDAVFPEVAERETRAFLVHDRDDLPLGTYLLREFYCHDPECDCRRVLLQVHHAEGNRIAASINYGFEQAKPPFDDEPQIMLDPLNPQSKHADALLGMFEEVIANDRAYRDRLVRHYTIWKAVVNDPSHPSHAKVRTKAHDDPDFSPAFPRQEPARRSGPRIGPNDPCPCGSGKKFKKCCRQ
jgi:hypothetical protein